MLYARKNNPGAECAFILSSDFSKQVESIGKESTLDFSSCEAIDMLTYQRNLYVMHNHPKNSSFSLNDISFFVNNIIKFERTDFMGENFNSGKDENINLTILNEINKAAKMGMDSISYVLKKVGDENMKENLTFQYTEYGRIIDRVNNQFDKYGEIPDEAPVTDKMMAWMGTQMNTMTDKSNSKIAELMIQGGDMGIIKCQKLLNHNPRANEPVKNILNDFVTLQKNDIEQMKKFL